MRHINGWTAEVRLLLFECASRLSLSNTASRLHKSGWSNGTSRRFRSNTHRQNASSKVLGDVMNRLIWPVYRLYPSKRAELIQQQPVDDAHKMDTISTIVRTRWSYIAEGVVVVKAKRPTVANRETTAGPVASKRKWAPERIHLVNYNHITGKSAKERILHKVKG